MIDFFFELGLENGFIQELESGDECFIPDIRSEWSTIGLKNIKIKMFV